MFQWMKGESKIKYWWNYYYSQDLQLSEAPEVEPDTDKPCKETG